MGGPPWRSHVCIRFTDHAVGADGEPVYENAGVLFATMSWGKIRYGTVYEDTQKVATLTTTLRRTTASSPRRWRRAGRRDPGTREARHGRGRPARRAWRGAPVPSSRHARGDDCSSRRRASVGRHDPRTPAGDAAGPGRARPPPRRPARSCRGASPARDALRGGAPPGGTLAERLAPLPVAAVYASPIERTTETAEAVAQRHQLEVRALEGVLEADYGESTGQKLADLAKTDLWKVVQRAPSRASFPGGESLAAMQARMVQALEGVVADHPGALVVVVSHADPIKAAIAHYTGVHLDLFQRIVVNPASVTALVFGARPGPAEVQRHRHTRRPAPPRRRRRSTRRRRAKWCVSPDPIELDSVDGLSTGRRWASPAARLLPAGPQGDGAADRARSRRSRLHAARLGGGGVPGPPRRRVPRGRARPPRRRRGSARADGPAVPRPPHRARLRP